LVNVAQIGTTRADLSSWPGTPQDGTFGPPSQFGRGAVGTRRGAHQYRLPDQAVQRREDRIAGHQGEELVGTGGCAGRVRGQHVHVLRPHDQLPAHPVREPLAPGLDHDRVTLTEQVQVPEDPRVPVTGDADVAGLAEHRGVRDVAGAAQQRGVGVPLDDDEVEAQAWDVQPRERCGPVGPGGDRSPSGPSGPGHGARGPGSRRIARPLGVDGVRQPHLARFDPVYPRPPVRQHDGNYI
jgi:hypothetical protein